MRTALTELPRVMRPRQKVSTRPWARSRNKLETVAELTDTQGSGRRWPPGVQPASITGDWPSVHAGFVAIGSVRTCLIGSPTAPIAACLHSATVTYGTPRL